MDKAVDKKTPERRYYFLAMIEPSVNAVFFFFVYFLHLNQQKPPKRNVGGDTLKTERCA